jgi:hypothetical protein
VAATLRIMMWFADWLLLPSDWGWGDLGANWPAAAGMTPHMDQLAAEGIRFTDFHVGASVCTVSRAALLVYSRCTPYLIPAYRPP